MRAIGRLRMKWQIQDSRRDEITVKTLYGDKVDDMARAYEVYLNLLHKQNYNSRDAVKRALEETGLGDLTDKITSSDMLLAAKHVVQEREERKMRDK